MMRLNSTRKRLLVTLLLLLLVVGAVAVFLFTQGLRRGVIPLGTPPNELSYLSNAAGTWDVLLLQPDGESINLSAAAEGAEAGDFFGSWAIDSQRLNMLSNRTGEMAPTQVEPDGSNPQSLDILTAVITLFGEGRLDWDPAWSPDGARLVWSSLRDLNLELYIIDTSSEFTVENATRLTNDAGRDWFAAWSPDGERIAFSSDREGNENIYVVTLATGEITQLTDSPTDELHPVWSLDGEQILYVYDENDALLEGQLTLWIMNADGSDARPFDESMQFEGDPTYSADGAQMAYMSNLDGDWNILLADADGTNIHRLTESTADDLFPVWRP